MINYGIGHYWDMPQETAISLYSSIGGEVHYGSLEEAKAELKRIQAKVPKFNWKIFVLEELK